MEPRPGNIPEEEIWLAEAAREYQPYQARIENTETTFTRARRTIALLDAALPTLPAKPNLLFVGLGYEADPLLCPYRPFQVAAHLEGTQRDYAMTLVDALPEIIEDVRHRTKIFLAYRHFAPNRAKRMEEDWQKYLADSGQEESVTYAPTEELKFMNPLRAGLTERTYLETGIVYGNVPPLFRKKLTTGDVSLLESDIATAPLHQSGPFDFVECLDVLYLMPAAGQQLTLANISRSMSSGGVLLLNDNGAFTGTPVFSTLGGWLDEAKMQQLGLVIDTVISEEEDYLSVQLRKG